MRRRYLVDTNILSYLEEKTSPFHKKVKNQFSKLSDNDEVFISVLTLYELEYSVFAATSEQADRLRKLVNSFHSRFPILPIADKGAKVFGELKAHYRNATGGHQKALDQHNLDFMIASTAIAENVVLVSNDQIFKAIKKAYPAFQWENWAV